MFYYTQNINIPQHALGCCKQHEVHAEQYFCPSSHHPYPSTAEPLAQYHSLKLSWMQLDHKHQQACNKEAQTLGFIRLKLEPASNNPRIDCYHKGPPKKRKNNYHKCYNWRRYYCIFSWSNIIEKTISGCFWGKNWQGANRNDITIMKNEFSP